MQDRFKFRFWNKLSNIMTYNFMFGNFMQKSLEDYEKKDWVGLNYEPDYICFNNQGIEDNLVIMQSTGLKDKNGKLIYEGDIVKETLTDFINEEIIIVVKWDELNVTYNLENLQNCEKEVIGNIYENPKLLEAK